MKISYYAHGKFFDTPEEREKFCEDWLNAPFDFEEFKKELINAIRSVEKNETLRAGKVSNKEAYAVIRIPIYWVENKVTIRSDDFR